MKSVRALNSERKNAITTALQPYKQWVKNAEEAVEEALREETWKKEARQWEKAAWTWQRDEAQKQFDEAEWALAARRGKLERERQSKLEQIKSKFYGHADQEWNWEEEDRLAVEQEASYLDTDWDIEAKLFIEKKVVEKAKWNLRALKKRSRAAGAWES